MNETILLSQEKMILLSSFINDESKLLKYFRNSRINFSYFSTVNELRKEIYKKTDEIYKDNTSNIKMIKKINKQNVKL
jgi:hypothetical protein